MSASTFLALSVFAISTGACRRDDDQEFASIDPWFTGVPADFSHQTWSPLPAARVYQVAATSCATAAREVAATPAVAVMYETAESLTGKALMRTPGLQTVLVRAVVLGDSAPNGYTVHMGPERAMYTGASVAGHGKWHMRKCPLIVLNEWVPARVFVDAGWYQ